MRHPALRVYWNWLSTLRWTVRLMNCAFIRHETADQIFIVVDGHVEHVGHLSLCNRCGWSRIK